MRFATATLLLFMATALPAAASWDDLSECRATTDAWTGASLACAPDGSGDALADARGMDGGTVDATIHVELIDWNHDPIAAYPAEDIWLDADGGGLALCDGGAHADAPTDASGRTTISGPIRAGGSRALGEPGALEVWINAGRVPSFLEDLALNSPDMDGDLTVDLTDVVLFAMSYRSGAYRYAADLHCDGQINLADLVVFAELNGTSCP